MIDQRTNLSLSLSNPIFLFPPSARFPQNAPTQCYIRANRQLATKKRQFVAKPTWLHPGMGGMGGGAKFVFLEHLEWWLIRLKIWERCIDGVGGIYLHGWIMGQFMSHYRASFLEFLWTNCAYNAVFIQATIIVAILTPSSSPSLLQSTPVSQIVDRLY